VNVSTDLLGFRGQLGLGLAALARLVAWLRGLGSAAGVGLAIGGVVLLAAADRLRRPVAFLGGAAAGALAATAGRDVLPAALSPVAWVWITAAVCGLVAAGLPLAFPALVGALVGAAMGLHVPIMGRPALGAAVAAAVGAALLAVGARTVASVLAALAGGLALGIGLVTLGGEREWAVEIAARPLVLLGFAVVTGVAGAVFQLAGDRARERTPTPPRLPRD